MAGQSPGHQKGRFPCPLDTLAGLVPCFANDYPDGIAIVDVAAER